MRRRFPRRKPDWTLAIISTVVALVLSGTGAVLLAWLVTYLFAGASFTAAFWLAFAFLLCFGLS